jgi:hypothetical protein
LKRVGTAKTRRQAQTTGGTSTAVEARPKNCMKMSETIAPTMPRKLWAL